MNLLDTDIALMLKDMQTVFAQHDIDFYLVGAVARDILLSADPDMASTRKTLDVDIAIMLSSAEEFKTLKAALLATGDFTAHPTEAIKIYYQNSIEVDLLPFGDIESVTRMTHLTDPTFVLHMPGFREIYPFTKEISVNEGQILKVCTLEGIVLLKLISHSDRPERTKDLTDIEHIISCYFDLNTDMVYDDHFDLMDRYDSQDSAYLQLISAHIIGRNFREFLRESKALRERIELILTRRGTDIYQAILDGLINQ